MEPHRPRQARSLQTLERLLDAAEEVLREKSFEEATVAEISRRAGFSVGAFFARFPTKEAMLFALLDRMRAVIETATERLTAIGPEQVSLAEAVRSLLSDTFELYRQRRSLGLAVRLPSRSDPRLRQALDDVNLQLKQALLDHLLRWRHEIAHPDPPLAVELGLVMTLGALRELMYIQDYWPQFPLQDDPRLVEELTRAYLAYLNPRLGPSPSSESSAP